jgi:hypothetical protein
MKTSFEQLIEDSSFEFPFGDALSRGFEIYKDNFGPMVGFTLIMMIIMMVVGAVPILGTVVTSIFLGPQLLAGLYIVCQKINRGESYEFGDFFKGFDYWRELATTYAIIFVVYAVLIIVPVTYLVGWSVFQDFDQLIQEGINPFAGISWTISLFMIPFLYLAVSWIFVTPIVVFHKLTNLEAMEASRRVASRFWFPLFAYIILASIIAMLGMIACFVGIILTLPIVYTCIYSAYDSVYPDYDEEGEVDPEDD